MIVSASAFEPDLSTPRRAFETGGIYVRAGDLSIVDSDLRVLAAGGVDSGDIRLELDGALLRILSATARAQGFGLVQASG